MKLLGAISLDLTDEQQAKVGAFWQQFGMPGRAMMAQPRYRDCKWAMKVAMLDEPGATAICDVLEKCKTPAEERL
jgi:hypothetical protein